MIYRGSSNAQQVPFDIFISSAVKRLALTGIDLNEDLYQGYHFYRKHKEIRKKLPSGLSLINCRMLSLGICNFTKQKVNTGKAIGSEIHIRT